MRVIIIGATGTIGKAVVEALAGRHEVVRVGHTQGDYQVDLASKDAIEKLFAQLAPFDAVISVAGQAAFKSLAELTDADFQLGLSNKLMGQVNVARTALPYLKAGGSITLTSGVLAKEPSPGTSAISLVNAGLEAFAKAAALEMPEGVRINVVSPPWVTETLVAYGMDPAPGMPAAAVARAYVASLEGQANGETFDARQFK